jgi:hypothetical protein
MMIASGFARSGAGRCFVALGAIASMLFAAGCGDPSTTSRRQQSNVSQDPGQDDDPGQQDPGQQDPGQSDNGLCDEGWIEVGEGAQLVCKVGYQLVCEMFGKDVECGRCFPVDPKAVDDNPCPRGWTAAHTIDLVCQPNFHRVQQSVSGVQCIRCEPS